MNQAIQFPDREVWDEAQQAIRFPALVQGFRVECAISSRAITSRFGGNGAEEWLSLFREHRWDLEEEAEGLIESEQEGDQGWYWLS